MRMSHREMRARVLEGLKDPDFSHLVITRKARTKSDLKPMLKGLSCQVLRVPFSFAVLFKDREEANAEVIAQDYNDFQAAMLFVDMFIEAALASQTAQHQQRC